MQDSSKDSLFTFLQQDEMETRHPSLFMLMVQTHQPSSLSPLFGAGTLQEI